MTTLLMWWREWCVVTLFGVKRSRDKIRKLSYRDMIQFCKIEGKENNAITYVSQSSYEIGSWEFPFKISIIRILYCLKSRELLCWKLNHFLDIWSTEEKLSNPLFPLNNSDKGSKISKGVIMGVKSLKRVCKLGIFSVILTFVKATIDGNKLLIFAYWPCIEN